MKKLLIPVLVALLLVSPAFAQLEDDITQNVTSVEDCVELLNIAQQSLNSLKSVYFLFTILFALLLLTVLFSAIYIVRARARLRRLEEIEAYEEISKARRKEKTIWKAKKGKKEEKKGGFFAWFRKKEEKKPAKKRKARKKKKAKGKRKRSQTVTVKVKIEKPKAKRRKVKK